ncbi:MAG: hypothetical protein IKB55_01865 [Clostridia bacterium]|nr:hypothetical protein [Clostridia bacterium]
MLKLGYAEAYITPDMPLELVGFNREDTTSKGTLAPLLAQVSVWENEERCCLITIDSLGFIKELADALRMKVGNLLNISKDKVMLCFSHTHSAPNAATSAEYFEMVCRNILSAIKKAMKNMQPVRIGYMNAEVDIGVNRRTGSTSLDKRAGILKVCDFENKIKLLYVRVTAHCNVLKRDNLLVSPDYFGAIRDVLKKEYDCPIMVIQGAAGNVAPKYFDSVNTPFDARGTEYIRSHTALQDMANAVAEKIEQGVKTLVTTDTNCLKMYSKEIVLRSPVPSIKEAEKISTEAKNICGIDGAAWLKEIQKLHELGTEFQEEKAEVQYISIGDFLMCGVPYELMTEFALDAVKKTGNEFFYVNGYTNGCSSYFPTEEEYELGGYEVYYSMLLYYKYHNRVFPFERESASKLIKFIIDNSKL